jgi:streptogrisin C
VVAVTKAERASLAVSAGADARVVTRSLRSLQAITAELDKLTGRDGSRATGTAGTRSAKLAGVTTWAVDVQANQVVVKVRRGQQAAAAALLARHGSAVRVEQTDAVPRPNADFLDGGDPYNGCSVAFNVFRDGVGHFLTAGHCGSAGTIASQAGVQIGPFVESFFPEFDDALVRNDNSAFWVQGPWVFAYTGDPGVVYNISGFLDSPVGTAVCKSGRTTGVTCGWIRAKNVTVNYPQGTVFNMTQTSACTERGDSGGAHFSTNGSGQNFAEGIHSGGALISEEDPRCLEKANPPQESVAFYQPIAPSIAFYGVDLMTL